MAKNITKEKESLTPLMQQYQDIKQNYKDAILFFRLGDFYEMFGEDAIKASPLLDIVLTRRQNIPMCGVPHHSVATYLSKLIHKGLKVAICEQVEDPSTAKGIVKREVVRLITPGTLIEENLLDIKVNNYLLSFYPKLSGKTSADNTCQFGISYLDISTGEFFMTEINDEPSFVKLTCELSKINPSEYIIPSSLKNSKLLSLISKFNTVINYVDDWQFEYGTAKGKIYQTYNVSSLESFGIDGKSLGVGACGALISYLENTQKMSIPPLRPLKFYSIDEYMLLDEPAIRNLELIKGLNTGNEQNSLLETIDATTTSMGSRTLRRYLLEPLTNTDKISTRQEVVKYFVEEGILRRQLRTHFKQVADLERILSRLSGGLANPRDLVALKDTLKLIPKIKSLLTANSDDFRPKLLITKLEQLIDIPDIISLISNSIAENPPADLHKTGIIREGYNKELDELRSISRNGKSYLIELERKEKTRTGISSLKIGYTSVFGYYIEITKTNLGLVPEDYIRKQTLINSERFITEELKQYENKVLSAEEKIGRMELEIFNGIRTDVLKKSKDIHTLASALAELDVYLSLAEVAVQNDYCQPKVDYTYVIEIKDGRHPVLERKLRNKAFVPNDTWFDGNECQIIVLTGPNMAGKSTYLRQVALITIMAQVGSFVPAKEAHIGIVDRIFTRIGSADNLVGGESTFMVEMHETANILHNATPRSLLILDEVGRGTSTFDGISIAWACVEYLTDSSGVHPSPSVEVNARSKVLFATHYFELTQLSEKLQGVKNYNVAVREWQDEVIFLYKIIQGCSDRSYGIHVAKLAGLPDNVVERAKEVLIELDKKTQTEFSKLAAQKNAQKDAQLNFFSSDTNHPVLDELSKIDTNSITPLEALKILSKLKERYEKNDS